MFSRLFGPGIPSLSAVELKTKLSQNPAPFLLDVRQPEEYRAVHIPGARLIPLAQLDGQMKELPLDREIVCVCQSGSRSQAAVRQLISAGYKAVNLRGGMDSWRLAGLPSQRGG